MASGVRCKTSPDQAPFAARDGVPGDQRGRLSRWDAAPKALMGDTDAAQHIGEPGLGVDAIEFGSGNQGINRGRALAAAIGTGEQPCPTP